MRNYPQRVRDNILSLSVGATFERRRRLSANDAEKKLERLMQQMRLQSCINALEKLAEAEGNDTLATTEQQDRPQPFTRQNQPSEGQVPIIDLLEMELSRVHVIWPALSSAQRKKAIAMGIKRQMTHNLSIEWTCAKSRAGCSFPC